MPVLVTTEVGHGPDIVLLHGVGAGPDTFIELATLLATDHRVLTVTRPGAGGSAVSLVDQAAAVVETMAAVGALRGLLVGVSGGATLALLVGMAHRSSVGGLVLHEPLVGSHVPVLHRRFAAAAADAQMGDAEAMRVVESVLGSATWQRLDQASRAQMRARAGWAREEIPMFAKFSPTCEALSSLQGLPVLATVGAHSDAARRAAATVLADLGGAAVEVIPGSGNAVQLDAPDAFARTIRCWWTAPELAV